MIDLTNRLVQEDLYKILRLDKDPVIWLQIIDGKKEFKLITRIDSKTTISYPYDRKAALEADYNTLINLRNKI